MNKQEIAELIPILQAFVDGKEVQREYGNRWISDGDEIMLDQKLRIKPEPREFLISVDRDGCVYHSPQNISKSELERKWSAEIIKVREVIE